MVSLLSAGLVAFSLTLSLPNPPDSTLPELNQAAVMASDLILPVGSVPISQPDKAWIQSQAVIQPAMPQSSPQMRFRPLVKVVATARAVRESKSTAPVVSTQPTTPLPASAYDPLFEKYGQQFGVDPGKLKRIANCESHINPSSNGTYKGMYQYLPSTWKSTRTAMGADPNPDLVYDPEQAILTTAWKIASGGLGAWPVCGRR